MKKHSPKNERVKRKYFTYLEEAKRQNKSSVDAAAKAIHRFEKYRKFQDFKGFHHQQAVAFKKHLANQNGVQSGKPLSKSTLHSTLAHLKRFFHWLAGQPGYKSHLQYSDSEYFNLSAKETRVATARRPQAIPTLEQIRQVVSVMRFDTEIEMRNRALIAFTILTGARDSAIASLKLKHLNIADGFIYQDAREVNTKYSKTITTYFFPVDEIYLQIVADWEKHLRKTKLWGNDDPLFPSTLITQNTIHQFEATGLARKHWSNASPIRSIFKAAFNFANLPYFNPHSFRNTLTRLGETVCRSPEDFKSWSQNYGHSGVLATFFSYGEVSDQRQGDILRGFCKTVETEVTSTTEQLATEISIFLRDKGYSN